MPHSASASQREGSHCSRATLQEKGTHSPGDAQYVKWRQSSQLAAPPFPPVALEAPPWPPVLRRGARVEAVSEQPSSTLAQSQSQSQERSPLDTAPSR